MDSYKFIMPKENSSIIKVIGVGGGGGNAVNHMYNQGIIGVDFIICNTDAQALEASPIPNKVQLGASLTEGMGAGAQPEVGKNAAIENIDDIKTLLGPNTKMLFITAGMGGGTGTGASPIIAKAAKELGILTVAIVTTPFAFEGKKRKEQAELGLAELTNYVDAYLVISNDKIKEIFGNLPIGAAFAEADSILSTAAKGIAEIITVPGYINVDFKDVKTTMENSGVSIMGSYACAGENRAQLAVEGALASPLLKDSEIEGARFILLNISSSNKDQVTMDEITIITDYIQNKSGEKADIIWGNCIDDHLEEKLSVTIIATGFKTGEERLKDKGNERIVKNLEMEEPLVKVARNQVLPAAAIAENVEPQLVNKVRTTAKNIDNQPSLFDHSAYETPVKRSDDTIVHQLEEDEPKATIAPLAEEMQVMVSKNEITFDLNSSMPTENKANAIAEPELPTVPEEIPMTDEEVGIKLQKVRERMNRLQQLSSKPKSVNELVELENEPAYRRRNMNLKDVQHSSESSTSRFTIVNDANGNAEIRTNNSFLHGNVD